MPSSAGPDAKHDHGPFDLLLAGLAAQAQVCLGLRPDPISSKTEKNLPMARQSIDMLGALEEKTKGNLTPEEARLLGAILADLRLAYVRASR
jgi:hypothetical protein